MRIPLRIVFYPEGQRWIAHCLEFDLLGDGSTQREAIECLIKAIHCQVEMSLAHDTPGAMFTPADPEYFEMFAKGKDSSVASGEFVMTFDAVKIESAEIREYVPEATEQQSTYAHA